MLRQRFLIALFILGAAALFLIPRAFTQNSARAPQQTDTAVPEKKQEPESLQIGDLQIESGTLSDFKAAKN